MPLLFLNQLPLTQGLPSLGLRGGPCGVPTAAEASDTASDDDNNPLSTSLEPKYFSQSIHVEQEDSDDGWNHCPENLELELQQGWSLFLSCRSQVYLVDMDSAGVGGSGGGLSRF